MLVRFRASNFLSLKDEQELSLVASSLKEETGTVFEAASVPDGILSVAALYGPNASGKSNVLNAFRFMCGTVRSSHTKWESRKRIPYNAFLLDDSIKEQPSVLITDAVIDDVLFQYGFSMNSKEFLREWLYAYPKGRRQVWFERNTRKKEPFSFGKHLTGENRRIEKLTRPNSLFISAAAQNNHKLLMPIYDWFSNDIEFPDLSPHFHGAERTVELFRDEKFHDKILDLMKLADLGISDVEIKKIKIDKKMKRFGEELTSLFSRFEEKDIDVEVSLSDFPVIKFHHFGSEGRSFPIDMINESHGTSMFFSLIGPVVSALHSRRVLVIDELETSIHPALARQIVKIFNSQQSNQKGAQLIFSTHSANLLGGDLLRRDQIWFTEKDSEGATHLYPLTDYKPRGTENVERRYSQGRYGAFPFLGDFQRLFNRDAEDESEAIPQ